jgi:peptidoglycan/LPS O-acetylase OafA/YrhL
MTSTAPNPTPRLNSIDALRGLAALIVVFRQFKDEMQRLEIIA